jgi:hypothetical protein
MEIVSKIYDAENTVIEKFCNANKLGDDALKKKNCALAKDYYEKALNLIPGEFYPTEQLKNVEKCAKEKEAKQDAVMLENAKKAEAAKLANQKAIDEKKAKEKAHFEKAADKSAAKVEPAKAEPVKETKAIIPEETTTAETETEAKSKGGSKYRTPKVIGVNHYKETITKADGYFKTKRYKDAKHAYETALKHKAHDSYATAKVAECVKLMESK